jgi:hypothetical protein
VEKFLVDLQEAIDAIRSTPNGIRYTEVHVLFLSWKDGTPEAMREIDELENVFSKLYRFDIHRHEIKARIRVKIHTLKLLIFSWRKAIKTACLFSTFPGIQFRVIKGTKL